MRLGRSRSRGICERLAHDGRRRHQLPASLPHLVATRGNTERSPRGSDRPGHGKVHLLVDFDSPQSVAGMTRMVPSNLSVSAFTRCPCSWTWAPSRNPSTTVPSMTTDPVTLLRTPLRWAVKLSAPASMIQSNSTCQTAPSQGFGPGQAVRNVVRSPSMSPDTVPSHAPGATASFSKRQLQWRARPRRGSEKQERRRHERDEGHRPQPAKPRPYPGHVNHDRRLHSNVSYHG